MPRYEYKVVPAPTKGLKAKGIRGPEARFSNAIEDMMNRLSEEGWEYQRAETLPSIERSGLTGSTTDWRNVLVFRRVRENDVEAFAPELLPAPDPVEPKAEEAAPKVAKPPVHAPAPKAEAAPQKAPADLKVVAQPAPAPAKPKPQQAETKSDA